MPLDVLVNTASTTVSSGGTDAPAAGTTETWTVASSSEFPVVASGVTQFRIQDPAASTELMLVANVAATSLTAALASGTAYTSLAVGALPQAMNSGDSLVVGVGATTQDVELSDAAAAGATSLSITSVTPSADFAVGTPVTDLTTPGANLDGTTWSVIRGVEGTTPVAHTAGFTVQAVATAGGLNGALASASLDHVLWPLSGYLFSWALVPGGDGWTTSANDVLYLLPLSIGRSTLITAIWLNMYTASSAGGVLRPAIYTDVAGLPADLVLDAGPVPTTTGDNLGITGLSTTMPRGRYWLGWVCQGNPSTPAQPRAFNSPVNNLPLAITFTLNENPWTGDCFQVASFSGVSGALPSSLGTPTWVAQQAVEIWLLAGN